MTGVRPGRLPAEKLYPAGARDHASRMIALASGLNIHIVETGPADGTPVVLVHGWGCWAYLWRHQLRALARAGYHAVAIDLPGHGRSDKPDDAKFYTRTALAHTVAETIHSLGLHDVALVGHSMGGSVALQLALDEPSLVSRLVLVSPVGFSRVRFVKLGALATPTALARLLPGAIGRWAVRTALHVAYASGRVLDDEDIDQYWAPSQHSGYAAAVRHLLHHFDWASRPAEDLDRLAAPLLVVYGDQDRFVDLPTDLIARAGRSGKRARALRLNGVGHVAPEEAPEAVNGALIGFLHEQGAQPRQ